MPAQLSALSCQLSVNVHFKIYDPERSEGPAVRGYIPKSDESWLLRQCKSFPVNFFENNIAAPAKKSFANLFAQAHRIVTVTRFAQNFCSVGMRHESVQMNAATRHFSKSSNRNLAASAQLIE